MSSISLPALSIHPPQQPDLLGQVAKVRQLQGMGQEQQLRGQQIQEGQLDLQMKQRAAQDQKAMDAAMQQWDGKNFEDLPALVNKQGGSAKAVLGLKSTIFAQKKEASEIAKNDAEAGTNRLKAMIETNDQMAGRIGAALNLPDDQLAPAVQQMAQQSIQDGLLDPQHAHMVQALLQLPPDQMRAQLLYAQKGYQGLKSQQEAAAAAAELPGKTAESQLKQMQLQSTQQGGAVPGVPLDTQEANSWLKQNPGKTLADYKKYASTLVPAFNFNMQNTGTTGDAGSVAKRFGMTPTAFDQAAEKYWTSGVLPPSGRGGPALALNKAIMNRTGELHPDGSLSANSAEYKANSDSLKKIQSNFDQVSAFENTAGKNLDVFLKTAEKVVDSGSPWVNKPLRMIDSGALGSQDQAAFNAARQTAVTEIAKVLNSSNASGVLSDSARHEVEGLIGPNASLKQIVSAAGILKQDMANRHQAYADQIGDIKGRMGGKSQPQETQQTQAETRTYQGHTYVKQSDGSWKLQ